jgi:hypothetical protein
MPDAKKLEQAKAEASGRRMAELFAEDVMAVLRQDVQYAELVRAMAVATLRSLQAETGLNRA